MTETTDSAPKPNKRVPRIELCRLQTRKALCVCDQLEALADQLPEQSIRDWRITQVQCRTILRPYFEILSEIALPAMLRQSTELDDGFKLLSRFKSDCQDQLHALADLDDMMSDVLSEGRFIDQPEALGFALRGFFEALRRDLCWQFDVLWPLADRTWSQKDADLFVTSFNRAIAKS